MKKKMWFVLCIMTSVLLTTACGEKKETAVQTETTMQTETAVQTETESDQDFQGRESLKLGLFTVYYPEEWKYDKERMPVRPFTTCISICWLVSRWAGARNLFRQRNNHHTGATMGTGFWKAVPSPCSHP